MEESGHPRMHWKHPDSYRDWFESRLPYIFRGSAITNGVFEI